MGYTFVLVAALAATGSIAAPVTTPTSSSGGLGDIIPSIPGLEDLTGGGSNGGGSDGGLSSLLPKIPGLSKRALPAGLDALIPDINTGSSGSGSTGNNDGGLDSIIDKIPGLGGLGLKKSRDLTSAGDLGDIIPDIPGLGDLTGVLPKIPGLSK